MDPAHGNSALAKENTFCINKIRSKSIEILINVTYYQYNLIIIYLGNKMFSKYSSTYFCRKLFYE